MWHLDVQPHFAVTYITEVESVDSGLDEEGIVWGQMRLDLCLLVLLLIVQLQHEQRDTINICLHTHVIWFPVTGGQQCSSWTLRRTDCPFLYLGSPSL